MTAVLAAEGIGRTFATEAGPVVVLSGVDLALAPGELVVLRGRSGAGKTTLLNILGGLDRPTAGRVLIDSREVASLAERELLELRRTRVASIFQDFGLLAVLSAAENVELPLRLARTAPAERDARVAAALADVGLADHAAQRPAELSGGQQQRVAIARALVARPGILLADEPTAQLDSATGTAIMDLLVRIVHERGMAAIVATHDPLLAERADRVLELRDGSIVHG